MYHLGEAPRIILVNIFVVVQMQCISIFFHYYNQNPCQSISAVIEI